MSHSHSEPSHADEHGEHHDDHGHGGIGKYVYVFLALCVLTSASFFTVSSYWPFHDTPSVGWAFMMAVSCTKALLVMSFFMHLIWEANWKYVLTIPASIMSLFLVVMLIPDVGLRTRSYSEDRWRHAPIPAAKADEGHQEAAGDEHHGEQESHGKEAGDH